MNIIENATVVYTDGIREHFEALRVLDKGIIIGRLINGEFLDCGYISKQNIKKIEYNGKK